MIIDNYKNPIRAYLIEMVYQKAMIESLNEKDIDGSLKEQIKQKENLFDYYAELLKESHNHVFSEEEIEQALEEFNNLTDNEDN